MISVVVHYKELALKGRNRPWFIRQLTRHLRAVLAGMGEVRISPVMGRLQVDLGDGVSWDEVRARLSRVFGVANFSRAERAPQDFEPLAAAVLSAVGDLQPSSFRVSACRPDKRFPMTSPRIEREVGGIIKQQTGWRVDLERPELTVHVEMLADQAFFFFGKEPGAGGLPTGTGGRVACLLSGGIDSPVAAYRMMRRGCSVLAIHFHSYPILSRASQDKVREIATLLAGYQLRTRAIFVPFGELQQQVVLSCPAELRVVLYRRLMLRIAERLARASRAKALVTGEVIGQVASQTLDNLTTIAEAASMEILRPLVGMDKDEIAAEAARLGTLPISNIPDQDCCTLFTPKHPATRARLSDVLAAESSLDIEAMVAAAVEGSAIEDFLFPPRAPAVGG
jgi:thiamine biosynthesis protein ThiI